jgi:hypothetical protein
LIKRFNLLLTTLKSITKTHPVLPAATIQELGGLLKPRRTLAISPFPSVPIPLRYSFIALFIPVASLFAGTPVSRGPVASTWDEAYARMKPWKGSSATPRATVSTMEGRVMAGYQGWFATPDDGSTMGWVHYGNGRLAPGHCTFEAWPDMSELTEDEQYESPFKYPDGKPATLFSSYNPATVDRHFRWMKDYGVDGVFLQRFVGYLRKPQIYDFRTAVTDSVRESANRHGRTWAMMYDLSGWKADEADYQMVVDDWKRLVDRMAITRDPAYQRHNGKPLVALWGVGFPSRAYNHHIPRLVEFLQNDPVYGGNAIMLGTTYGWRDGTRDAKPSPELLALCAKVDIVSPWSVGRYGTEKELVEGFEDRQKADLHWCNTHKIDYLPVIFPGFSWHNLMKTRNQPVERTISRGDGSFYWAQGREHIRAGARMLYIAMFDEVDEATSVLKITNTPPVGASTFITNEGQPADHYLWLSGRLRHFLQKRLADDTPPPSGMPSP